MKRPPAPLRSALWLLLAALTLPCTGFAQKSGGRGGPPAGPVPVQVLAARPAPIVEEIPTVGTLRANESVQVVSELSRRLVRVEVEEGASVEKGQLLFKLDDAALEAELAEIDARLALARSTEERNRELTARKAISDQTLDESVAQRAALEALKRAREVELAKTGIRAPFSGRVGVRAVSEGAWVTPALPLLALQDLSRIKVDFPVPARFAGSVKPGMAFTFTVAGDPAVYEGTVAAVEPAIDEATRSLQVRGVCANPGDRLLPGSFAEVRLQLGGGADAIPVPTSAVVPGVRGQAVWVVKEGRAALRDVEIGLRSSEQVQVLRGLAEGDSVILTNLLRLRPGVQVEVKPAP